MNTQEYFLGMAESASKKSKDPSSKVGAIIVDEEHRTVSTGYNGHIAGCNEAILTYERPMKYFTIIHAEMNALIYARRDLKGCKVYTTFAPCENCLKHLLAGKIREIYYTDPGIMRDRGSEEQKEAIVRLMIASGATVMNINGTDYIKDLYGDKADDIKYKIHLATV